MFLNTFHWGKDLEKMTYLKWSLIVSIIQTSKFYMDLYFQNDVPDS